MDKRLKAANINAASTLVHQLIATCCGMIIPWIMIDTYGSVAYGATTSIAQFLSYVSLFEGGIGRVARGALYGPLAAKDTNGISRVYLAIKRFFRTIGFAFAGYAFILAFCYHDIADVTIFTREYTFMLVISIAISKFAEYVGGISNITLFNADQKQYIVNSAYIVTNIFNTIIIVVLATCKVDIIWVKFASSIIFVFRPLFYTFYLKRHYNIVKTKERAVLPNKRTGIAQHCAYVMQNNTDVLILTVLADLKAVAVYSVYHLVTFSVRNIVSSFTGGMEAVFGDMLAKNEQDDVRSMFDRYKLLLTILTIVFFGSTAILIVSFVSLYTSDVTDANYIQPVFAIILIISEALNCLVLPCFNLTIAANKLKESQLGALGEAAINLVSSVILVLWNPLVGVALGTLLSTVYKVVFYIIYSGRNILKIKVTRLLINSVIAVATLVGISVGGMLFISNFVISNYIVWALFGVVSVLITGIIALAVGYLLYPKAFIKLIKRS